jgi:DGQHR domain-containing protein
MPTRRDIPALRVKQWLAEWNAVDMDEAAHRRKPPPHFYLFSIPANDLRALSGICRRDASAGLKRHEELGIQRRHDPRRSREIVEYVRYGHPWADLSAPKRASAQYANLRKPGWLPTAIVVNILESGDKRRSVRVSATDLVRVEDAGAGARIVLPDTYNGPSWRPSKLAPIQVIDGQHRLWAFEQSSIPSDYELPVVAFHGLDISWEAYLFWTINIKPKRINASLAFDLYPLLRTEEWLEAEDGLNVYRETRAQELVEALWSNTASPWFHRINMLGDPGQKMLTQAAWVRALTNTLVKAWEGRGKRLGGLFGAPIRADLEVLPWSRAQQAAFLIRAWQLLFEAIRGSEPAWAKALRPSRALKPSDTDPAVEGPSTLLNADSGLRGVLHVLNDVCYVMAGELRLGLWETEDSEDAAATDDDAVAAAVQSLKTTAIDPFLTAWAEGLATYDWRSSSAPSLTESERVAKLVFRGSGGYKELRKQLLRHLTQSVGPVSTAATQALDALN